MKYSIYLLSLVLGLMSCNGLKVDQMLKGQNPYNRYLKALEGSELEEYALVREWKMNGQGLGEELSQVELPYTEMTYFNPQRADAKFWKYAVREGQEVTIEIRTYTDSLVSFFMDVFDAGAVIMDGSETKSKWFAKSDGKIQYRVDQSGIHSLRIQPEIFRGGMVELKINYKGILSFPIPNRTTKNIASFWGDPRDGNRRKHEGIDVFAPRGTPVLAASDGRIRRVGNNRLGGKVIWLRSSEGHTQYYAHLDSQMVGAGQTVNLGDTIGLVGNTGNARTTLPHLHFGVYKSGSGAVNPLPFVIEKQEPLPLNIGDTLSIKGPGLVVASRANIRSLPSTRGKVIGSFSKNTYFEIEGKTRNWYRITLPDGQKGFLYENLMTNLESPIATLEIMPEDTIQPYWNADIGIMASGLSGEAKVLGYYNGHALVETNTGFRGWKPMD